MSAKLPISFFLVALTGVYMPADVRIAYEESLNALSAVDKIGYDQGYGIEVLGTPGIAGVLFDLITGRCIASTKLLVSAFKKIVSLCTVVYLRGQLDSPRSGVLRSGVMFSFSVFTPGVGVIQRYVSFVSTYGGTFKFDDVARGLRGYNNVDVGPWHTRDSFRDFYNHRSVKFDSGFCWGRAVLARGAVQGIDPYSRYGGLLQLGPVDKFLPVYFVGTGKWHVADPMENVDSKDVRLLGSIDLDDVLGARSDADVAQWYRDYVAVTRARWSMGRMVPKSVSVLYHADPQAVSDFGNVDGYDAMQDDSVAVSLTVPASMMQSLAMHWSQCLTAAVVPVGNRVDFTGSAEVVLSRSAATFLFGKSVVLEAGALSHVATAFRVTPVAMYSMHGEQGAMMGVLHQISAAPVCLVFPGYAVTCVNGLDAVSLDFACVVVETPTFGLEVGWARNANGGVFWLVEAAELHQDVVMLADAAVTMVKKLFGFKCRV